MKFAAMTAAAALLTTGTAFAGSIVAAPAEPMVMAPSAPLMMPSQDWTGGYAGASLGYGYGEAEDDGRTDNADGFGGGLFAGYNYDFGTLVMGGEVEIVAGDISDDTDGDLQFDSGVRLKLKAGADLGQTLVYGLAGASYAEGEFNNRDIDAAGYLLGAGAEYRITPNVGLGAELIYERFEDFDNVDARNADVTTLNLRALYAF